MSRVYGRYLAALMAATLLVSCNATGGVDKQTVGTVGGGVLGGLLGSQFGSGAGRVFATIAGTAAGAWLGNQLGRYLDEQDRATAAAAVQKAAVTGQPQNWANPQSGVRGRVAVAAASPKQDVVAVSVKKQQVEKLPPLDLINKRYVAIRAADLRSGPESAKPVVGGIPAGREVVVMGKARGTDWYLIGENGVGTGFVSAAALRPVGAAPVLSAAPPPPASSTVEVQRVSATRNCRTLTQTIILANGQEHKEEVTSCEGPNGWEVQ